LQTIQWLAANPELAQRLAAELQTRRAAYLEDRNGYEGASRMRVWNMTELKER
jgi:hypothetical protein